MNQTLGKRVIKFAIWFYELKVEDGAITTFLARIWMIETAECLCCGAQKQTDIQLYKNVESGEKSEGS